MNWLFQKDLMSGMESSRWKKKKNTMSQIDTEELEKLKEAMQEVRITQQRIAEASRSLQEISDLMDGLAQTLAGEKYNN